MRRGINVPVDIHRPRPTDSFLCVKIFLLRLNRVYRQGAITHPCSCANVHNQKHKSTRPTMWGGGRSAGTAAKQEPLSFF
jgi:hypothetical protein